MNQLDLNSRPLSLASIHHLVHLLVTEGEVQVVNCERSGPAHAAYLIRLMASKLSDEDRNWLRMMVREELE